MEEFDAIVFTIRHIFHHINPTDGNVLEIIESVVDLLSLEDCEQLVDEMTANELLHYILLYHSQLSLCCYEHFVKSLTKYRLISIFVDNPLISIDDSIIITG